jgi:hypothetical protein
MVTVSIAERVAAGVAWLDAEVPDWWRDIRLDRLEMASCTRCVLGQVFGEYGDAPLGDLFEQPLRLGFNVSLANDFREFGELTAEWRRVIEERRAQTAGAS